VTDRKGVEGTRIEISLGLQGNRDRLKGKRTDKGEVTLGGEAGHLRDGKTEDGWEKKEDVHQGAIIKGENQRKVPR